jgi:hypothetical protein
MVKIASGLLNFHKKIKVLVKVKLIQDMHICKPKPRHKLSKNLHD